MFVYSKTLRNTIAEVAADVIELRRRLHRIPETGFEEVRTAAVIADALQQMGLCPRCGIAETGITARLTFAKPGPTLMLRADMDALPVQEATGLPFASERPGHMHACGHDGHMAMALGTAMALSRLAALPEGRELAGEILFLFQPAEESLGGAVPMIAEGVLKDVDYCLACHIWPDLPQGVVGVRPGFQMASMDKFDITLTGRGGHGSQPHLCDDAAGAAARLVLALHEITSRKIDPQLPAVLSVGAIQCGDTYNVIPATARVIGTFRCYHREVRDLLEAEVRRVAANIADGAGLACEMLIMNRDGPVDNDPYLAALVAEAAARALCPQSVVEPAPSLAGEDFSRYQEQCPGCLFFLGVGREGCKPLHNPAFDFDDAILPLGVRVFCETALQLLNTGPGQSC